MRIRKEQLMINKVEEGDPWPWGYDWYQKYREKRKSGYEKYWKIYSLTFLISSGSEKVRDYFSPPSLLNDLPLWISLCFFSNVCLPFYPVSAFIASSFQSRAFSLHFLNASVQIYTFFSGHLLLSLQYLFLFLWGTGRRRYSRILIFLSFTVSLPTLLPLHWFNLQFSQRDSSVVDQGVCMYVSDFVVMWDLDSNVKKKGAFWLIE